MNRPVRAVRGFLNKYQKVILICSVCFVFVLMLVQIFWPKNIMLPFSKVNGSNVSFYNRDKLEERLKNEFHDRAITLETEAKVKKEFKGSELAKISKIDQSWLDSTINYPLGWRFVPFSFLAFRASIDEVKFDISSDKINNFADEKAKDLSKQPKNAVFSVKGDKVNIKSSEDGVKVESLSVKNAVKDTVFKLNDDNKLPVKGEKLLPEITTGNYEALREQAEAAIAKEIYFMLPIGNRIDKFTSSAEERASLLDVVRSENGEFALTLKDDELSKMFGVLEEKVKKEPGVTVVKMINGKEAGRNQGLAGQGLNFDDYKDQMFERMFNDDAGVEVDMKLKAIPPVVRYEREFTNSNEGLQSYLDDVTKGRKITVSVQQLSGKFWSASSGGDKRMTSASTYKLFMAQFIMNKIDNGQLNWGSSALGTNVEGCMYNMIVKSANDCPEYWLSVYGRNAINNYLQSMGYGSVFSSSGEAASTSANSLKKVLTNLYFADNFSAGNANRLRDLMLGQIYRQGIPSGTKHQVADKVGFLGGVLNDAGIVYHPKVHYAIVIMTEGESWAKIADITRQVEKIMYEE